MKHTYMKCTQKETGKCTGCSPDSGLDCKYESLGICSVCGGMEGSLLPECPGRRLSYEEDQENYRKYCAGEPPFPRRG